MVESKVEWSSLDAPLARVGFSLEYFVHKPHKLPRLIPAKSNTLAQIFIKA
jgi:hypothetical protein